MDSLMTLLCSLLIGVVASNAALLPAQVYWNSVLPNTRMPNAISDLLSSDTVLDTKTGTTVNVGKGGVYVNAHPGKPGATTVGVGKGGVHVVAGQGTPGGTTVGVGKGGVHVVAGKGTPGSTTVGVGKGGVNVGAGNGKPGSTTVHVGPGGVTVNVKPKYGKPPSRVTVGPFSYNYAATEDQLHNNRQINFFFLEHDLHPGSKITMQFEKINTDAKFLLRSEAETIPFSSKKLPEIISRFSVQPGSDEEEAMKETLKECEDPVLDGEKKMCATSLESMVDFTVASLGTKNVKAVSTTVYSKYETPRQEYTIVSSGVKNLSGDELVACHQQTYAYAVFYCHMAKSTKGYTVKMTGKDGTVVDAAAVCHTDTSAWNPKHVAFQVLNVKPGTVPVCHFLPQDHVVFSRNK
ncbi:BURP domain-containing protein [Rhynchospora pubera]|uniref:BURP domain-containing protein n=1 Tax=Rhynchospora pubera TaxID=906938 RepID=A0AAV8EQS3_9POAL|nr:BURP domain-containing protein [Rhynchospora pubera]